MFLLHCSFDFANSVYSAVVLGLMGPLLVNGLAKQKAYGNIAACSKSSDILDLNYTIASAAIQNYRVSCRVSYCLVEFRHVGAFFSIWVDIGGIISFVCSRQNVK